MTLTTVNPQMLDNGPAFSAYQLGLSQSLTTGTSTKIQFNTEEFDTASAFDNTTNYRFTPQVAGYYQVNLLISFTTLQGTSEVAIYIYKNNAISRQLADTGYSAYSYGSSALVYLNGSTDYIEAYAYTGNASTKTIANNSAYCYFQAYLARAA